MSGLETSDSHRLFRPLCLRISNDTFQTQAEVSEISLLLDILEKQASAITELTEFESGLQFAQLRLLELRQLKWMLTNNPYYSEVVAEAQDFASEQESLLATCKDTQQRRGYFEKMFGSYGHVVQRWRRVGHGLVGHG